MKSCFSTGLTASCPCGQAASRPALRAVCVSWHAAMQDAGYLTARRIRFGAPQSWTDEKTAWAGRCAGRGWVVHCDGLDAVPAVAELAALASERQQGPVADAALPELHWNCIGDDGVLLLVKSLSDR